MNDRTITRAARQGARTQPVPTRAAKPAKEHQAPITPDELAEIIDHAPLTRIETDIAEYGARKRTA